MSTSWSANGHIASFVRTLHLLDLDQRKDWPDITSQAYSAKSNLQQRLRCTEWALYQLFELYDARLARDKLQPFFPATTSLQSMNLRNALLRQLTELKKDGILGTNILLRKTMLDDCKGEKFEELLATFAGIVLRRIHQTQMMSLGLQHYESKTIVALIIAYRVHLQHSLDRRKQLKHQATQRISAIREEKVDTSLQNQTFQQKVLPSLKTDADTIKALVRTHWINSAHTASDVLNGFPKSDHRALRGNIGIRMTTGASALDAIDNMQHRLRLTYRYLGQWKAYLDNLTSSQKLHSKVARQGNIVPPTGIKRFRQHRELSLVEHARIDAAFSGLHEKHTTHLAALQKELSSTSDQNADILDHFRKSRARPYTKFELDQALGEVHDAQNYVCEPYDPSSKSKYKRSVQETHMLIETPSDTSDGEFSPTQLSPVKVPITRHDTSNTTINTSPETRLTLTDRTRQSLMALASPSVQAPSSISERRHLDPTLETGVIAAPKSLPLASLECNSSLLERTRRSLARAQVEEKRSAREAMKLRHKKASSMYMSTQEEPILNRSSIIQEEASMNGFNVDMDDPFRSRPKLAMSPVSSPLKIGNMKFDLNEAMEQVTL